MPYALRSKSVLESPIAQAFHFIDTKDDPDGFEKVFISHEIGK